MDQWITLVTQGGAIAVLVIGAALALSGRVEFRQSVSARDELWRARVADVAADRDEWKAQARALIPAVDRLAEAVESRNKRDERTTRRSDPT